MGLARCGHRPADDLPRVVDARGRARRAAERADLLHPRRLLPEEAAVNERRYLGLADDLIGVVDVVGGRERAAGQRADVELAEDVRPDEGVLLVRRGRGVADGVAEFVDAEGRAGVAAERADVCEREVLPREGV